MKKTLLPLVFMAATPALAQTYAVDWSSIDGGGVTASTGGPNRLGGTIGQPDASNAIASANFSLVGGFWAVTAPIADLAVTKTDGQAAAVPGQPITYTMVVTNNGPNAVTGAIVSDTLPAAVTAATWSCLATGDGTCAASGSGSISDTIDLPAGATATYTLTGTIDPSATGSVVNTASVASPGGVTDPNPANNSATDTDTLTPQGDLSVTTSDAPDPVAPSSPLTYTVQVSNNGPSTSTGMALVDTLPPGVTFVSSVPGSPTCMPAGPNLSCNLSGLAPGASATVTINVTSPSSTGTITNSASVTGNEPDPVSGNNVDQEITLVSTAAPGGRDFFTLSPCRVVDTRGGAPIGGPILQAQETRVLSVAGICGIPSAAKALSINVTATQASAPGNLRLFPAGPTVPNISTINFTAEQNRANNAIVSLNANAQLAVFVGQTSGTVHLIIDVNGYFE